MTLWARGGVVVIILKPGHKNYPSNHRIISWVDHRVCMHALENRKISYSWLELIMNCIEFCLSWRSEVSPNFARSHPWYSFPCSQTPHNESHISGISHSPPPPYIITRAGADPRFVGLEAYKILGAACKKNNKKLQIQNYVRTCIFIYKEKKYHDKLQILKKLINSTNITKFRRII
jgi:hypothetical protein